jgi:hypothetical protein
MAISNFVVARSETGVGEHAVSDRTAQVHPVKTVAGKKPAEQMQNVLEHLESHGSRISGCLGPAQQREEFPGSGNWLIWVMLGLHARSGRN